MFNQQMQSSCFYFKIYLLVVVRYVSIVPYNLRIVKY